MIDPKDIHSLSDFQRNAKSHIRKLKRSGRVAVLTVNGKAAVVVQDAETYQKLLDQLAEAEEVAAIQESLKDLEAGKGRPIREFAKEFRARRPARRRKSA